MKLWQLLAGVPLTGEPYSQDMEITSISYDTRTLLPGALFVALPGAKTDGSLYIDEALGQGLRRWYAAAGPSGRGSSSPRLTRGGLWPCWRKTGLAILAGR